MSEEQPRTPTGKFAPKEKKEDPQQPAFDLAKLKEELKQELLNDINKIEQQPAPLRTGDDMEELAKMRAQIKKMEDERTADKRKLLLIQLGELMPTLADKVGDNSNAEIQIMIETARAMVPAKSLPQHNLPDNNGEDKSIKIAKEGFIGEYNAETQKYE